MIKPDPNTSRIKDIFSQTLTNLRKTDELEQLKYVGPLLFQESEVCATNSLLDRLLRRFCVDNHVSEEYFSEKYKMYALCELGMHPTQASNNRSNLTKAIKAGNITFKTFINVLTNVLGYEIDMLELLVKDETSGKKQKLTFKEPTSADKNQVLQYNESSSTVCEEVK